MKNIPYIHIFAGISIAALGLQIFSDFWFPIAIGAAAMLAVAVILRR